MKHIKLLSLAHFTEERIMALKDYAKVDRYPNNVNNRDEEEVVERLHGADIALINHVTPISRRVLDARPDLRFIVTSTVGVDHIDLEYCRERDVHVRWFPGYCARTLAEHSFTFILMGLNFIAQAMDNARNGRWDYMNFRGREAKGRRLLILGLGKTGKYLKELAECFGMNVMWTNSKTPAGEVDAMISSADVISLHMSLNPETRGFLDRRRLGLLKSDVVLVNTARGALIDENAMWEFMDRNERAVAFLDVLEQEPPDPNHRVHSLQNVVLTPHVAWSSDEGSEFLWNGVFDALKCAATGEWTDHKNESGWL